MKQTSDRRSPACPQCASGTERVQRDFSDRLIGIFLPTRRYRCLEPACGWCGLLLNPLPAVVVVRTRRPRYRRALLEGADGRCARAAPPRVA